MNEEIVITGIRHMAQNTIKNGTYYETAKTRDWYSIGIVTEGDLLHQSEHGLWHFSTGEIFFIEPNHGETVKLEGDFLSYIYIDIFCESPIKQSSFLPDQPHEYIDYFDDMLYHWNTRQPGYHYRCLEITYGILFRIIREQAMYTGNYRKHQKILPALLRISKDFSEPLDCKLLAELCGISTNSLNRLFLEITGRSPMQYLSDTRINYAKNELVHGVISIGTLAEQCGFADIYSFSHAFKRATGFSPTEWSSL